MVPTRASSSRTHRKYKYDVFLNFRGEDVRYTFVSHLYERLCEKRVVTFLDDKELERGEEIQKILEKIEESRISIMIFSENYAESQWCLEETVKIMECRKEQGQQAIPVFYHIEPSVVRRQSGSFGEPFLKHERDPELQRKVPTWKAALKGAGSLLGSVFKKDKSEAEGIRKMVDCIWEKLEDLKASEPQSFKFDVFLNFRGEDVRYGFLHYLKMALDKEGIKCFYDADLKKGEEIDIIIEKIKVSKMSIMIFSKGYASSSYCLEELVKILECKKTWGHMAAPVFYHVPPDVVANQSGIYAKAFRRHENEKGADSKKVLDWRKALGEATGLSGQVLENRRPEIYDIQEIVDVVKKVLEEFDEVDNSLQRKRRRKL